MTAFIFAWALAAPQTVPARPLGHQEFLKKLVVAAVERTNHVVCCEPAYVGLATWDLGGDVPHIGIVVD